uniref:Putative secreted peptide n=1 Tax=Anopheles braziliensis TaxID=58242 RepID=A0A2M3ZTN4_9DIPT
MHFTRVVVLRFVLLVSVVCCIPLFLPPFIPGLIHRYYNWRCLSSSRTSYGTWMFRYAPRSTTYSSPPL